MHNTDPVAFMQRKTGGVGGGGDKGERDRLIEGGREETKSKLRCYSSNESSQNGGLVGNICSNSAAAKSNQKINYYFYHLKYGKS